MIEPVATALERALQFATNELREYAFASPADFAASLEEFALRERVGATLEEREACAKILDEEAEFNSGENENGYVNNEAEGECRRLAKTIRNRGQ